MLLDSSIPGQGNRLPCLHLFRGNALWLPSCDWDICLILSTIVGLSSIFLYRESRWRILIWLADTGHLLFKAASGQIDFSYSLYLLSLTYYIGLSSPVPVEVISPIFVHIVDTLFYLPPIVYHGMSSIVNIFSVPEVVPAHFLYPKKKCPENSRMPLATLNIEKLIEVLRRVSDGLFACYVECVNNDICDSINVERNRIELLIRNLEKLVDVAHRLK